MRILYTFLIYVYGLMINVAAFFTPKARKWVDGRQNYWHNLESGVKNVNAQSPNKPWIWFHCASLGEFEQGRPLIEKIHRNHSIHYNICITFFSPSGYDVRKHYPLADLIAYLPLDTPANAKRFVRILNPSLIVFVKYELWPNFLRAIREKNIYHILISARWRKNHRIFRFPLQFFYQKVLSGFSAIFTQDSITQALLKQLNPDSVIVEAGDTRFDSVVDTLEKFQPVPEVEKWVKGAGLVIVGGSTWAEEEAILMKAGEKLPPEIKLLIAPHEIHPEKIHKYVEKYPEESVVFSELLKNPEQYAEKKICWIDQIGLLSRLYKYADIALVGGGFSGNLHNILEPCVYGSFILFGSHYNKGKFPEATDLTEKGGALGIQTAEDLEKAIKKAGEQSFREKIRSINKRFVQERTGATEQIYKYILEEIKKK